MKIKATLIAAFSLFGLLLLLLLLLIFLFYYYYFYDYYYHYYDFFYIRTKKNICYNRMNDPIIHDIMPARVYYYYFLVRRPFHLLFSSTIFQAAQYREFIHFAVHK